MSPRRTSRRDDALRWSPLAELAVDRNETPVSSRIARLTKFGEPIQTHIGDTRAAGRPPQRSRTAILDLQQRESGIVGINALDRERLIQFGCARPEAGAGPVTPGIDVGMRHSRARQCAAAPGFGPNSAVPPPGVPRRSTVRSVAAGDVTRLSAASRSIWMPICNLTSSSAFGVDPLQDFRVSVGEDQKPRVPGVLDPRQR